MNSRILAVAVLLVAAGSFAPAQEKQFVVTLYGGLFFPSSVHFKDTYQSTNDAIWGFGAALPVYELLSIAGDISFFRSEAFLNPAGDSSASLEEKFIHLGLLNKQPITGGLLLRLSAGINFVSARQKTSGPQSPEQSAEVSKKFGGFGGLGVEEYLGSQHFSVYADALYDYSRSHEKELPGDLGGLRLIVGIHMFMF